MSLPRGQPQALEILFKAVAGELNSKGKYPKQTINAEVINRLREIAELDILPMQKPKKKSKKKKAKKKEKEQEQEKSEDKK